MITVIACAALAQTPLRSLNSHNLPPSKNDYWFVALGDDRPAGAGLPPTGTFKQILREVATIGPEFVISSGDLLYGNEETLAQYKQEVAWMKPLIQTLPCPFFNAPGNHEINNRPEFLKAYLAAFGPAYGSFDFGSIRFVAVCTEFPATTPTVYEPQLSWLKQTLDGSKPAIVFQHHPIFPRPSNAEKETASVSNGAQLHEIYRSGGVKMVLEGHDHIYDAQVHDGIDYRIAGGAGAPLDGPTDVGGYYHFLLVHVQGTKITPTVVPMSTLEIVPMKDGQVAAAEYAYLDLPVTNVRIWSSFRPGSVKAAYGTKTGKSKSVKVSIVSTQRLSDGYETRVSLVLPRAKATIISLGSR